MARKYSSVSNQTTLATGISSTATTMTVATGTGAALLGGVTLAAGNVDKFTVAIDPDTASEEIVFITAVTSDTFTVERAKAGTSGIAHSGGATVKHVLTSVDLDAFEATTNTAATLTGTQTLTNKTIALGSNTVSGTIAQFNTAMTDVSTAGQFVTTQATQTLTNKTLTSPTVNSPTISGATIGTSTLNSPTINTPSISNINAKGDILVGTANDTLGVISVGTNGQYLQADSAEATGLKWASTTAPSYTWTDYTPTLVQSGTVTATVNWAKYADVGNIRFIDVSLSVTGSGTSNNIITVSIPSSAVSTGAVVGSGYFYDTSDTTYYPLIAETNSSTTVKFVPAAGISTKYHLGAGQPFSSSLASGDLIKFQATVRI